MVHPNVGCLTLLADVADGVRRGGGIFCTHLKNADVLIEQVLRRLKPII